MTTIPGPEDRLLGNINRLEKRLKRLELRLLHTDTFLDEKIEHFQRAKTRYSFDKNVNAGDIARAKITLLRDVKSIVRRGEK